MTIAHATDASNDSPNQKDVKMAKSYVAHTLLEIVLNRVQHGAGAEHEINGIWLHLIMQFFSNYYKYVRVYISVGR